MKYTLPAPKKVKKRGMNGQPQIVEEDDLSWLRRVRLPANNELIDSLEVGETATITLQGKIVALEMRDREGQSAKGEVEINVTSIETEGSKENDNVYTQMAKEED